MNDLDLLHQSESGDVYIVASGPSAGQFPLAEMRDSNFITVNGAVRAFLQQDIRPLAYVFNDESFIANSTDLVVHALHLAEHVFMPAWLYDKYLKHHRGAASHTAKIYFINKVNRIGEERVRNQKLFALMNLFNPALVFNFNPLRKRTNSLGFSKDIRQGYFCARTIAWAAIQLAYFIGFNRVYLVGVDLNADQGRFYDTPDNRLPSRLNDDFETHILPSFRFLNKVTSDDFQVFNLSRQSRLDASIVPTLDPA